MSSASPFQFKTAASTRQRFGLSPLRSVVQPVIEFVAFWAAIVLPFVLLTIVASGLAPQHPEVVGGLLVSNVAGLRLGRGYNR